MNFLVKIDDVCTIECYLNDIYVGYINYCFTKNGVWLNKIKVLKEYRNRGVGTALIRVFENEVLSQCRSVVEGKYFPEDEENEIVKGFYIANGYNISREGYETEIYKNLVKKHDLRDLNIEYLDVSKGHRRH